MMTCLFCDSNGPFSKPEHIVPEALGNNDLILRGEVCDQCNQYFGSKIESFVLGKTPLAFWRTFLGIRKKGGALPHVDLSQPKMQKGKLPSVHNLHDNLVSFMCHEDYVSVEIGDDQIVKDLLDGSRDRFTFVFTHLVLSMMGRFFCKVGLELLCLADPNYARSEAFSQSRRFARFGEFNGLWPIYHATSGEIRDLRHSYFDSAGCWQEVLCYRYGVCDFQGRYVLFALTVGTDTWVVSLNDPFATPDIQLAFPGMELKLIWYSPDESRE